MDTSTLKDTWKKTPSRLKVVYRSLSPERVILFWLLLFIGGVLLFSALVSYNSRFLISVPSYGGKISEGIVGTPRFINPVLATSEQDVGLTSLVFAGLTKKDSLGNTMLDMAQSIEESQDGLRYKVTLKPKISFHDGKDLTTDDVIYTINLIQNPTIKSPHFVEWEGVTMEKINDKEMIFILRRPFPLFMDILTIGIMPRNVWRNLTDEQFSLSDLNVKAIGSGPYKIKSIKSRSGIPYSFELIAHENYTLGRPFVDSITITTYQNERYALQAFEAGDINRIHGINPTSVKLLNVNQDQVHSSLLPRTFTVFFNPNKSPALSERKVRQALNHAINKEAIVKSVLEDYGSVINAPYPFDENQGTSTYNIELAKTLLAESKAGNSFTITLATANTDEMRRVADMIKADWEAIGVTTTLAIYEVSDLNQSVIREREFQALLYGTMTKNPSDLYAFWHSSQRNYPGLNISNYVSSKLDTNLQTLREESDILARTAAYDEVKTEFEEETPGIFLFAPSLIYITRDKVYTSLPNVSFTNSSRFALVHTWYRYSEKIWPATYYKQVIQAVENIIH